MKKAFITLVALISVLGAAVAAEPYATAVLPFTEKGAGVQDKGAIIANIIFAALVEKPELWMVEREDISKILQELELNASGMVNPQQAAKVGELSGAKILITGSVFKSGSKTFIIAKIIGTETSRVLGASINGTQELDVMAQQLGQKIAETISKQGGEIMPKIVTSEDTIKELTEKLGTAPRPALYIKIKEEQIGRPVIDPAAETELKLICQKLNFKLVDNPEAADVLVSGEAISQFGASHGALNSVRARLEDRFLLTTGDALRIYEVTRFVESGRPQFGSIPWHVGVIPGQPRQPRAVRAEAGCGVKIVPKNEHAPARFVAAQVERHERVDGLLSSVGVILAHGDQPVTRPVDDDISIAIGAFVCQRFRHFARAHAVQALILEVGEIDCPVVDHPISSAILMDARARVPRRRDDVGGGTIRRAPHDHLSPAFQRPTLRPIEVRAVNGGVAQPN